MRQDHFKEAHLNQEQKTSMNFRRLWFDLNLWLRNFQFEIKYKFQGHYKLFTSYLVTAKQNCAKGKEIIVKTFFQKELL